MAESELHIFGSCCRGLALVFMLLFRLFALNRHRIEKVNHCYIILLDLAIPTDSQTQYFVRICSSLKYYRAASQYYVRTYGLLLQTEWSGLSVCLPVSRSRTLVSTAKTAGCMPALRLVIVPAANHCHCPFSDTVLFPFRCG